MKYMYITNNVYEAEIIDNCGVDYIFIDLEILGKHDRQGHLDTVISKHELLDIKRIKEVTRKSEILVRINPFHENTKIEIDTAIEYGADNIMLPFFKTKNEVQSFIEYIDGRVKSFLLLETSEAVNIIDDIIKIPGIDHIHIGLNDLHLSLKKKFMFELLSDGLVELLCKKISLKGIDYGFGGVAKLGFGELSAEKILAEHHRLKSKSVILSRSFCDKKNISNIEEFKEEFERNFFALKNFMSNLDKKEKEYFESNKTEIREIVDKIVFTFKN